MYVNTREYVFKYGFSRMILFVRNGGRTNPRNVNTNI